MYKRLFYLFILFLLSSTNLTFANTLKGKVIGIADGDTITVLDSDKTSHKIRLSGIDAPEKGQPYGRAAKRTLSKRIFEKTVEVDWHKKDRYGRLVGIVSIDDYDVNYEQVRNGYAWYFAKYRRELSDDDKADYLHAERAAQSEKIGIWKEKAPTPPWSYRRNQRQK